MVGKLTTEEFSKEVLLIAALLKSATPGLISFEEILHKVPLTEVFRQIVMKHIKDKGALAVAERMICPKEDRATGRRSIVFRFGRANRTETNVFHSDTTSDGPGRARMDLLAQEGGLGRRQAVDDHTFTDSQRRR